jgi:hypothetical protein
MYEHLKAKLVLARYRLAVLTAMMVGLVASVSAGDLNDSISALLASVTGLFPSLVDLVVAAIPVIVVIALAAFIVGFLDSIIRKLK